MIKSLHRILLVFLLSSLNLLAEFKWQTDMKTAQKQAQKEDKDIFAYFTGSDWCTYCIMLKKEVFNKEDFLEKTSKKYVMLKIDFPQRKPLPEVQQQINDRLSESYSVEGFPTVLLLDKDGRAFGKTGYKGVGPEEYSKHLDNLATNKIARDTNFTAADSLQGVSKAEALIKALEALGDVPKNQYQGVIQNILKADPEDKTGFKRNIQIKQKLAGLEALVIKLVESEKGADARAKIKTFIDELKPEGESRQKALLYKVYTYEKNSVNLEEVDKLMDQVIAINPKTETADQARELKAQILQMKNTKQGR